MVLFWLDTLTRYATISVNSITNHTNMGPLHQLHSLSVATVGTKGQIVIPLDIREQLSINPGDKVVVLMRGNSVAVMLPMEGMQELLDKLTADFDHIRTVVKEADKDKKED